MVCCLFALWGHGRQPERHSDRPVQKRRSRPDTQTALVQSIFFLGYFVMALPAAAVIKRYSYRVAIVIGCACTLGCFLFIPAAQIMTYGAFRRTVIATGLSFWKPQ